MILKEKINLAAQKWAIDTKKKFPHLSEPEFIAGAEWAITEMQKLQKKEPCENCGEICDTISTGEMCANCFC